MIAATAPAAGHYLGTLSPADSHGCCTLLSTTQPDVLLPYRRQSSLLHYTRGLVVLTLCVLVSNNIWAVCCIAVAIVFQRQ